MSAVPATEIPASHVGYVPIALKGNIARAVVFLCMLEVVCRTQRLEHASDERPFLGQGGVGGTRQG